MIRIITLAALILAVINCNAQSNFPVTATGIITPQQFIGTFEMFDIDEMGIRDPSEREYVIITSSDKRIINVQLFQNNYENYSLRSYVGFISSVDNMLFLNLCDWSAELWSEDGGMDLSGVDDFEILRLDLNEDSFTLRQMGDRDNKFASQDEFFNLVKKNKDNSFFYGSYGSNSMNKKKLLKL
jgi:hypothetical protein